MKIIHVDLDNTLIHKQTRDDDICVEIYDNKPLSFISKKTWDLLNELQKRDDVTVIPTTTRTVEQYKRINFGGVTFQFALGCNGGKLLIDGEPCDEWFDETLELIEDCEEEINKASKILNESRDVDGLFVYTKTEHIERLCAILNKRLDLNKVAVHVSGKKVYVIPKVLEKGNALTRLQYMVPRDITMAAGDSSMDYSMVESADIGFTKHTYSLDKPTVFICNEGDDFPTFFNYKLREMLFSEKRCV